MEFVDHILSIASSLYSLCEEVKANKKRCQRLAQRVKALEDLVLAIKQKKGSGQISADVKRALRELKITLDSATEVVKKYTSDSFLKRITKAYNHGDEFGSLNDRLNDAFQVLSLALQVDHNHRLSKLFEVSSRRAEDEADREEDHAELQKMLQLMVKTQDATLKEVQDTLKEVKHIKQNMETMIEMPPDKKEIKKPSVPKDIREIKPEELNYDIAKKPFVKTSDSEFYKAEYKKSTVAIKRYTYPMTTNPSEVRKIFEKEIQTMKHFESPNILRMFGICVQNEKGPNPNYLIVMEYCEKGSLRQVLDSKCKLPWDRKARMCLDAAQGLYRLHLAEDKSKVHGNINSDKFLVADGYRVKLGGLELSQTETSLRRTENLKDQKQSSLQYRSPEQLQSLKHPYCRECEIYSLGIVLWEIATRKKPFDDCSTDLEVYKRVCEDKQVEPLPEDCPKQLRELIYACRSYDSFHRPMAGVLVDKLRKVAEQMEE